MSYWLGIDVGTTFTAAAICREEAGGCRVPEVVALGAHSAAVSSVVYLAPDGQVVVGQAAEQHAQTHPERLVREFTRRVGDEVPMVIGGVAHTAAEVTAMVVGWVVERVAQREGGPAAGIVLTHPAGWGSYKIQTMAEALQAAGLPPVRLRPEPEVAALSYALAEPIGAGSTIAVYDLGGGTCDVAIVRKTGAGGFAVLGQPRGIAHLGGADFDDAVLGHVLAAVPALRELDDTDPATLAALAALRRECTDAKEALSADTEVTIPVHIGQTRTQVRLVRAEFDDLIRPQLTQTLDALHQALRSAKLTSHDLDAVLLAGGSSRIPLVAQLVSAEFGRPLAIDADPKTAIALGAALSALPTTPVVDSATCLPPVADPDTQRDVPEGPRTPPAGLPVPAPPQEPPRPSLTAIPLDIEPAQLQWRRARTRRLTRVVLAGVLALFTATGVASVPFLTSRSGPIPPVDAGIPAPGVPIPPGAASSAANPPVANVPAVNAPAVGAPVANAGSDNDGSPSGRSGGAVRTTAPAAPNRPAGGTSRAEPAAPPLPAPPPTWVTTWTSTWSSPPTHSPAPEPSTPATTATSEGPPPTTPPPTTPPPATSPAPRTPLAPSSSPSPPT